MSDGSIWDEVLDTEHAIVVRTYIERWPRKNRAPEKVLIVVVEPDDEARNRCPRCGNRGVPVESDVRRWRTLDVHGKRCYLESAVPRIECAEHGKITAAVPWARHDDRFTIPFEDHAAWLAAQMPWTKASAELRITWEALANIVARVTADAAARPGPPRGPADDRDRREILGQGQRQVPHRRHRPRRREDRLDRRGPQPGQRERVLRRARQREDRNC